jgi:hypothetical protein
MASSFLVLITRATMTGPTMSFRQIAFPDGNSVYVKFNTADEGCKWNFKIEWADPGYPGVVWHDVDLCHVNTVTLKYDRGTDKTTAELE